MKNFVSSSWYMNKGNEKGLLLHDSRNLVKKKNLILIYNCDSN